MCIPQLEDAYKRFTKDKWFEGMMGNQEKRCLLCLYRAFRMICQLRNIKLDAVLQGEIPDNYKVDRTIPKDADSGEVSEEDSEDDDDTRSEISDDSIDAAAAAGLASSKKKRPKALTSIASVRGKDGKHPPIQILTDNRKKDKYIWIKISAAPDCLKGIVDNTYDSAEETIKALVDADSIHLPSFPTPSAPPMSDIE